MTYDDEELARLHRRGAAIRPDEDDRKRGRGRGSPPLESRPSSQSGWNGDLASRTMVAMNYAPAVVKITSFNRGVGGVKGRFMYVSREGDIPLETDQGTLLHDAEEIERYVRSWSEDFSDRVNARDSMSLMLSTPAGTPEGAAKDAMRDFLAAEFGDNHSYVFAYHDDTPNFHCHAIIKVCGHDGKRLHPSKNDLRRYRERYAAELRERQIKVEASPRWARGQGQTSMRRGLVKKKERGEPLSRNKTIATILKAEIAAGNTGLDEAEKTQLQRNSAQRIAYAKSADALLEKAKAHGLDDVGKLKTIEQCVSLTLYAQAMPTPQTLRRSILNRILSRERQISPPIPPGAAATAEIIATLLPGLRHYSASIKDKQLQRSAVAAIGQIRTRNIKVQKTLERGQDRDFER